MVEDFVVPRLYKKPFNHVTRGVLLLLEQLPNTKKQGALREKGSYLPILMKIRPFMIGQKFLLFTAMVLNTKVIGKIPLATKDKTYISEVQEIPLNNFTTLIKIMTSTTKKLLLSQEFRLEEWLPFNGHSTSMNTRKHQKFLQFLIVVCS